MNKYPIIIVIVVLFLFLLGVAIFRYRAQPSTFLESIPLIPKQAVTPAPQRSIITPTVSVYPITDVQENTKNIDSTVSFAEKNKVIDFLPYRLERMATSVNIITAVIVESTDRDPVSALRIGIYGIDYAQKDPAGRFATAFRESFLEAKKFLVGKGVNLKNLQIIYSDYQYAQDTASYWVDFFKLRD